MPESRAFPALSQNPKDILKLKLTGFTSFLYDVVL